MISEVLPTCSRLYSSKPNAEWFRLEVAFKWAKSFLHDWDTLFIFYLPTNTLPFFLFFGFSRIRESKSCRSEVVLKVWVVRRAHVCVHTHCPPKAGYQDPAARILPLFHSCTPWAKSPRLPCLCALFRCLSVSLCVHARVCVCLAACFLISGSSTNPSAQSSGMRESTIFPSPTPVKKKSRNKQTTAKTINAGHILC